MKSTIKSYADSLILLRKVWLLFLLILVFSSMGILFGMLRIAPHRFPIKDIPVISPIRPTPLLPPSPTPER
jgi:hypothetical protein